MSFFLRACSLVCASLVMGSLLSWDSHNFQDRHSLGLVRGVFSPQIQTYDNLGFQQFSAPPSGVEDFSFPLAPLDLTDFHLR